MSKKHDPVNFPSHYNKGDIGCIDAIKSCQGDGFKYYLQSFFEEDGIPKYYNDRKFPIDIHCPAQFFNTIFNLNKIKVCSSLVDKVFQWSIENMQHESGYFYYQINKLFSSKISYMRWSNAFMFNSLTNLKLAKLNE